MTVRRLMLAAGAAMTLGTLVGAIPASAQYDYGRGGYGGGGYGGGYRGDDYDRPRRYNDDYDRPPPRRFGRRGSICVTGRGNCPYPPAPTGASCRCDIPDFGPKRGNIVN